MTDEAQSNILDSQILKCIKDLTKKKDAVDDLTERRSEANGHYRSAIKHFRDNGLPVDEILDLMKRKRKSEPEDIVESIRLLIRVAGVMGMPVLAVEDFPDLDPKVQEERDDFDVQQRGEADGRAGIAYDPELYPAGSRQHSFYATGHARGVEAAAEKVVPIPKRRGRPKASEATTH